MRIQSTVNNSMDNTPYITTADELQNPKNGTSEVAYPGLERRA